MTDNIRSSNIELLRIIAMLMIVAHHFSVHGGFAYDPACISVNELWVQFIQIGGKIGVDIFVLITGYHLVLSKSFKISKVFKLWFQLLFYSVTIFGLAIILGIEVFSKKHLLDAFFPVSMSQWWFASTYFVLFLLSPFINVLLNALDKATYKKFLALMLFMWCVLPTISAVYPKFTVISPQLNDLLWFITLYSLAAYLRLWHDFSNHTPSYYLIISISTLVGTFLSAVFFDYLNMVQKVVSFNPAALYGMTSLPIILISVTALLGFIKINMSTSRFINTIASATFGVYLISDHSIIRHFLWVTIFKNAAFADSGILIPYSIAVIMFVYLICTIIELLRKYLLERQYMPAVEKISEAISKKLEMCFGNAK